MGSPAHLERAPWAPPRLPGSYLVVELTNRCSLRCVHCAVAEKGHPHHARTGMMDPAIFEAVVDDLVRVGGSFDSLVLFWLGEPLLHPFFDQLRRYALRAAERHATFGRIEVHTNATHLGERRTRALLNGARTPQTLHFSLDAIDRDRYHRIKGVDRFEQVQSNVENFMARKVALGALWPRPVFQFIVGSNNVDQARGFRQYWEDVCRRLGHPVRAAAGEVPEGHDAVIFFRQLDCPSPEQQEEENASYREEMTKQGLALPLAAAKGHEVRASNLHPCSGFWKSPVIGFEGELTTCTLDSRFSNSLGNIREHSFSSLWWGERLRGWREQVARGDYGGLKLCQTCFIPQSINHTEISDEEMRRQARWAEVREE